MKDLALHILDVLQNSIRAEATIIKLQIDEAPFKNKYKVKITDNGTGMSKEMVERITDPFFTTRTTRKVGLGLSLLKQNAERTQGTLKIKSRPGKGTEVEAVFGYDHIDRIPTGDIGGILSLTISSNPEIEFKYNHHTPKGNFEFDTKEIKLALGEISISNAKVISFLNDLIHTHLIEINAS
jgi:hypothetical protein